MVCWGDVWKHQLLESTDVQAAMLVTCRNRKMEDLDIGEKTMHIHQWLHKSDWVKEPQPQTAGKPLIPLKESLEVWWMVFRRVDLGLVFFSIVEKVSFGLLHFILDLMSMIEHAIVASGMNDKLKCHLHRFHPVICHFDHFPLKKVYFSNQCAFWAIPLRNQINHRTW